MCLYVTSDRVLSLGSLPILFRSKLTAHCYVFKSGNRLTVDLFMCLNVTSDHVLSLGSLPILFRSKLTAHCYVFKSGNRVIV